METFPFFCLITFLTLFPTNTATAQPLSTNSRWIVDQRGRRVKLACTNWVTHLEPVTAEGLSKRPVDKISNQIVAMGFNCVRLTWPLYLVTNNSLASLTVRQSFQRLGLNESLSGIQANNPSFLDLSLIDAYKAVVGSLGKNKVMVILDNHISKPGWCCGYSDGNGFFGDIHFNPDLWVKGLTLMATLFRGTTNVVGMSLRNELRGSKQNVNDWYRYMQRGAEAVHSANPEVLVILSGLTFDTDLSFLRNQAVNISFTGKLVFEIHWYAFSDGSAWASGNPNEVCGRVVNNTMRNSGFLVEKEWPLFVSEWGVDLRGTNVNDNRYLNCFLGFAAELDLDWAHWTLVGSYYLREGVVGLNEFYGVMDWNWCDVRNSSFLQRISALQSPFRGPGYLEAESHKVIFHPLTGLCIVVQSLHQPLRLGPCNESGPWTYLREETLTIQGTNLCLIVEGLGKPTKFCIGSKFCSKWKTISDSKMHLSSNTSDGVPLCLDVDSESTIVTNKCKCLSSDSSCDPSSQWFKLVDSTRRPTRSSRMASPLLSAISDFFKRDFWWKLYGFI